MSFTNRLVLPGVHGKLDEDAELRVERDLIHVGQEGGFVVSAPSPVLQCWLRVGDIQISLEGLAREAKVLVDEAFDLAHSLVCTTTRSLPGER